MEKRAQERLKKIEKFFDDGEYVYELFSIMIHSGSASGGHYYAYIKNFEDNLWYNFNDSYVSKIKESDISKMYGDGNNDSSKSFFDDTFGANAYLLMYRKVTSMNLI